MQYRDTTSYQQAERRFFRPGDLHIVSAQTVKRLARRHRISEPYARALCELIGIGEDAV